MIKTKKSIIQILVFILTLSLLYVQIAFANQNNGAKNVIIMIGDGMGMSHFRAAQIYSEKVLNKKLFLDEIMRNSKAGYVLNDTADTYVTESAAAAGQMATGKLMNAKTVSMLDNNVKPKTILEIAKELKMATGLVTTSGITDATPAAFSSHVSNRFNENEIAKQQIELEPDVLMGGRREYFLPLNEGGKRIDNINLINEAKKKGYVYVESKKSLELAPINQKLLGLFNMKNMNYEIDRAKTYEPSLAQMADKALKILSQNKNGFFVMIEGGRIDHAAHENDTMAMIYDVIAFDNACKVAYDFFKANPDTLLIITADHETGGLALIGNSKNKQEQYGYVGIDTNLLSQIKSSYGNIVKDIEMKKTIENVITVIKQYCGITITSEEAEIILNDTIKNLDPYNFKYKYIHSIAFVLRPYLRVGWCSQTHTAEPVWIFALGPNSNEVKGLMHNTEIFNIMYDAIKNYKR